MQAELHCKEIEMALIADAASEYFDRLSPEDRRYRPPRMNGLPTTREPGHPGVDLGAERFTCLEALRRLA